MTRVITQVCSYFALLALMCNFILTILGLLLPSSISQVPNGIFFYDAALYIILIPLMIPLSLVQAVRSSMHHPDLERWSLQHLARQFLAPSKANRGMPFIYFIIASLIVASTCLFVLISRPNYQDDVIGTTLREFTAVMVYLYMNLLAFYFVVTKRSYFPGQP